MNKTVGNFLYQASYYLLNLLVPLVTMPYVARVLGPMQLGRYHYIVTIVNYFTLVAGLGLSVHGVREIALVSDDRQMRSRRFSELFYLNFVITTVVLLSYLIFIWQQPEKSYFLPQGLLLLGGLLDISWLYFGLQDFKTPVRRNLVVKLLSLVLLVFLVKGPDDLQRYFWLSGGSVFLGHLSLWWYHSSLAVFVPVTIPAVMRQLKPSWQLFSMKLQAPLVEGLGKLLLIFWFSSLEVGYLSLVLSIVWLLRGFSNSLNQVLLPVMSQQGAQQTQMIKSLKKSLHLQLLVGLPMSGGLLIISRQFVPWFFGAGYQGLGRLLILMAPLLLVQSIEETISLQFLIPTKKYRIYRSWLLLAVVTTLTGHLLLIPWFGAEGAVLSLGFGYLLLMFQRLVYLLKKTPFRFKSKLVVAAFLATAVMLAVCFSATGDMPATPVTTIAQILLGSLVYVVSFLFFYSLPKLRYFIRSGKIQR